MGPKSEGPYGTQVVKGLDLTPRGSLPSPIDEEGGVTASPLRQLLVVLVGELTQAIVEAHVEVGHHGLACTKQEGRPRASELVPPEFLAGIRSEKVTEIKSSCVDGAEVASRLELPDS